VLVTFLASVPITSSIKELESRFISPERLEVIGQEAYLHCPGGYGKTKLSNTFIEKQLGVLATTRNWKSVINLHKMSTPL